MRLKFPYSISPRTLFWKNRRLYNDTVTRTHTPSHSNTHRRETKGCRPGLGPWLCPCRTQGKRWLQPPCTGSLLPELIYSEGHLGTENNVLSYLNDRPY